MTTLSPARPATARDILNENGDLPDEVLLGRLVLFTITDEPTRRDDLEQWFDDNGLDKRLLPPEIKPIDAFKKATSEAKEKYTLPDGTTAVVLCRDVHSNGEYVKRQITREVKDSNAKQLSYTRAIEATFYRGRIGARADGAGSQVIRGSERVNIRVDKTGLSDAELSAVQDIARNIVERYQKYYEHLDGNRLRATVRDYLKHLNAVEIKGGVYFVHVSKSAELAALQSLVQKLGGGCAMHTIPLVDIVREREMVAAAFEREASQNLQDIAKEARALLEQRKNVTPDAYAKIKARYDEVTAKAQEHLVTLQISQDVTGASAEMALNALVALQKGVLQ